MASPVQRAAPSKWLFTKEQMKNTASQKEGMSREEELTYRQLASAFIQEMIDGLNNVKDPKAKIGHTGICVAHTHMHRFYYWHSFRKYDYRDVGAACVFLAGKSQECPRKLSHVVGVWRDRKDRKQLTTETARNEAAQIIVLLESMILQTIAFDLNIHLPHVFILNIMEKAHKVSTGKYTEEQYNRLKSTSFYFATDVIAVTDWVLRYSSSSMSIAIVSLMAAFSGMRMEKVFPDSRNGAPWYQQFEDSMTNDKLREMETDFMQTYSKAAQFHYASKFIPDFRENRPPPTLDHNPDVRKIDRAARDARSHSPMISHHHQTALPDSTVPNGRPPRGYVPKDELTVERLNKERVIEEERRKRDHDRMAGKIDNSTSSEKRARIDPLSNNFVTSSSSSSSSSSQNHSTSNGKLIPPIPSTMNFPPPGYGSSSSSNSRNGQSSMSNNGHNRQQQQQRSNNPNSENVISSSSSSPPFRASARAFDVEPMLTPPVVPQKKKSSQNVESSSDMEMDDDDHDDENGLEDGEVE